MSIVGEAFVAVSPIGAGFGSKLESQLAGSGFAGNVEKQLSNAGVLGGNAFTNKITKALKIAGISGGQALGAGIAVAAIAGLSAIGSEFLKTRNTIIKETGATGASLAGLFDTVKRSVLEVPASLGQAATAIDELFKRGVPLGPQLDQLAKQELFLAKVTKDDLASTVDTTTALLAKFNVPLADQSRELDVLFKAYQASGKGLSELTSNLQSAGGVLQSFGFSLDKSAALVASLEKAGVNLAPALAGLRLAFGKITSEGGDPQRVLANLIKEFTDGTPKAKAMADAIQLFGKRSGAELSIAISKGKFDVEALLKTITDGQGGIIATGEATLTMGDRFLLLRNRVFSALSDIAITVRRTLGQVVVDIGPPIIDTAAAVGNLIRAAAPVGIVFLPLVNVLRTVGPLVSVFAGGLSVVTSGLSAIPQPALVAVAALSAILFTSEALAASLVQVGARLAFAAAEFAIANPEIAIAAAAIGVLGIVAKLTADSVDPAIKAAKDFGAAAFDAGNKAGVFKDGISGTHDAIRAYLTDQLSTHKLTRDVADVLVTAKSSVTALASAVAGGDEQWKRYKQGLLDAAKAHSQFGPVSSETSRQVQLLSTDLDTQRRAFQLANKDELTNAVVLGQISPKMEIHIKNLHRAKDGTVDFGAAVDDLNKRLASQATAHDKVVLAADTTAVAEEKLTKQLAAGAVTDAEVTSALKSLGLTGTAVSKELDRIKQSALALNQAQDLTAASVAPTTKAYGDLTREIAQGTITQSAGEAALRALGFSAAGAGTQFSTLQGQVRSFIDGAVSQLPTVGQAIADFAQQITTDQSQLDSDKQASVTLHERLDKAIAASSASAQKQLATVNLAIAQDQDKIATGNFTTTDKLQRDLLRRSQIILGSGKASQQLRDDIAKNNAAIIADNKKLADDNNPDRFTQRLLENAAKVVSFTANLQKLVTLGLAPLAGELAKQGPNAAAGLAAGLASSPAKAIIAEKAVELGKSASDNFRKFLENNAPELIGTGAKQGLVIGKAIADGITQELVHNFPFLRQFGITTGTELLAGAQQGAGASSVTDSLAAQVRRHIPEFRGLGIPVGAATNQGFAEGAGRGDVMSGIAKQLTNTAPFNAAGLGLGAALDEGISQGIILSQAKVGGALITLTAYGVSVVAGQWKIKSPSKVFADLGAQVGDGLAQGIVGSTSRVGTAAAHLASATTGSIQSALSAVSFDPRITPTIEAHVVPLAVPPIPPVRVDAIVTAPRVEPVVVPASFSPIPAPSLTPVTLQASFGPVAPPPLTPVVLDVSVPPIPRQTVEALVDATVPPIRPVVVPAALGPIPTPSVPPLALQATLAPIPQPTLAPVTIAASLTPPTTPPIPPVVIAASLGPVAPPRIAPVVAPVVVPPIGPVIVPATLSSLSVPPLPQATVTVAPVTIPKPEPLELDAHVGPVTPPTLPPIPAALAISVPPVGAEIGQRLVAGVDAASGDVHSAVTRLVASVHAPLQSIVDPSITPGQTLAAGFADSFGTIRSQASDLRQFLGALNIGGAIVDKLSQQFSKVTDAKTAAGFVSFADGLVTPFQQAFQQITVDAGQLQHVLDALTVQHTKEATDLSGELLKKLLSTGALKTQFAPPQPPSNVTFTQAEQSVQVAQRPEDRADAQRQQHGPFAGATIQFPDKTDPLHLAAELAWMLL